MLGGVCSRWETLVATCGVEKFTGITTTHSVQRGREAGTHISMSVHLTLKQQYQHASHAYVSRGRLRVLHLMAGMLLEQGSQIVGKQRLVREAVEADLLALRAL